MLSSSPTGVLSISAKLWVSEVQSKLITLLMDNIQEPD